MHSGVMCSILLQIYRIFKRSCHSSPFLTELLYIFNISYILSSLFFVIFLATLCILGWNSVWSLAVLFFDLRFCWTHSGLVVWACWTVYEMVKLHQSLWFLERFNYDHVALLKIKVLHIATEEPLCLNGSIKNLQRLKNLSVSQKLLCSERRFFRL